MASGVPVDDQCMQAYQDLKLKQKYRYIIFKINEANTIVIDSACEKTQSEEDDKLLYDRFVSILPKDDCRYAVYDFQYQISPNDGKRKKICFFFWAPDTSKVKQKMIYAASKDALRKQFVGIANEIQGTDFSEVDFETVFSRVKTH